MYHETFSQWPCPMLSEPQTHFDFCFAKTIIPKLSPGYTTVSKSIVKICQRDLLKVTDLKRSAKISFRNAPYAKLSLHEENYYRNVFYYGLALSTFKIYQ